MTTQRRDSKYNLPPPVTVTVKRSPRESVVDDEDGSDLEEGIPLLPKIEGGVSFHETSANVMNYLKDTASSAAPSPVFGADHRDKMLCYDQDTLLTSQALMYIGSSVFVQKPVLYTLLYGTLLAAAAATCVYYIPKASKLDTSRFDEFSKFLQVFISFMLGIYVQQAFKRWWDSVSTFEKILIDIRQLVFMLHTIKVTPIARKKMEGYCIASGYVLNVEVHNAQIVDKRKHVDLHGVFAWLEEQGMLSESEITQLQKSTYSLLSSTRGIWSFIACCCSQPQVEEGVTVLPPLLTRTIVLCQSCIAEIEKLKMTITMQTPFMYASLLAILVHVNNTILSISCGMSLGSAVSEIRRRHVQLDDAAGHHETRILRELYEAAQTIGVKLLIVLLAPMIYVAFLHIAHILCYPFGDETYHLPTETLIGRLHAELNHMSDNREYFNNEHKDWFAPSVKKRAETDTKGLKDEVDEGDDGDGGD